MAEPKEQSPNYLEAVGQILFESQDGMTDADHFVVVQRGIDTKIDTANRALVYDYARTHIVDPELQTKAMLFVATNAAKGIMGYDKRKISDDARAENRARFAEATDVLRGIVIGDLLNSTEVLVDSFNLTLELETKLHSFDAKGRYDRDTTYYTDIFDRSQDGYYRPTSDEIEANAELAAMAVLCLDAARSNFPEAASVLGRPLHKLYMGQLKRTPQSGVGDKIIGTVLELIDESTYNAVTDSLWLVTQAKEDSAKRAILDRAIAITIASDREQLVKVQTEEKKRLKRGWFGIKREVIEVIEIPKDQPSDFDDRLALLKGTNERDGELKEMLQLYPDYVKQVVELHSPEAQEELWQQYAEQIAGLAFTNGSYKISEISQIMGTVQRFGEVAPAEIAAHAKEQVQHKLAQSSPTTNRY